MIGHSILRGSKSKQGANAVVVKFKSPKSGSSENGRRRGVDFAPIHHRSIERLKRPVSFFALCFFPLCSFLPMFFLEKITDYFEASEEYPIWTDEL
jgi:hypothetical protein